MMSYPCGVLKGKSNSIRKYDFRITNEVLIKRKNSVSIMMQVTVRRKGSRESALWVSLKKI